MRFKNEVSFSVKGAYALFTDPVTRMGGEKATLLIPTYQALKGICESVYWKPSIIWYMDAVRIIKPIRTESKGIRPIRYYGGNDLSYYNYLSDVEYQVKCHFVFNPYRPDLRNDFNENKHYFIAKRCIERGGRRDVYLGTRECQAYVEPVIFGEGEGYYDDTERMELGFQYHSLRYPDETGKEELTAAFWYPVMKHGVIIFTAPEECPVQKILRKEKMKQFDDTNFSNLEENALLNGYREGVEKL